MSNLAETRNLVDYEAIKAKQQVTWGSGNYAAIGSTIQLVGELLCESAELVSGSQVLDVAAGNGNSSLAAARRSVVAVTLSMRPETGSRPRLWDLPVRVCT